MVNIFITATALMTMRWILSDSDYLTKFTPIKYIVFWIRFILPLKSYTSIKISTLCLLDTCTFCLSNARTFKLLNINISLKKY